jgi:hypothetical protein
MKNLILKILHAIAICLLTFSVFAQNTEETIVYVKMSPLNAGDHMPFYYQRYCIKDSLVKNQMVGVAFNYSSRISRMPVQKYDIEKLQKGITAAKLDTMLEKNGYNLSNLNSGADYQIYHFKDGATAVFKGIKSGNNAQLNDGAGDVIWTGKEKKISGEHCEQMVVWDSHGKLRDTIFVSRQLGNKQHAVFPKLKYFPMEYTLSNYTFVVEKVENKSYSEADFQIPADAPVFTDYGSFGRYMLQHQKSQ